MEHKLLILLILGHIASVVCEDIPISVCKHTNSLICETATPNCSNCFNLADGTSYSYTADTSALKLWRYNNTNCEGSTNISGKEVGWYNFGTCLMDGLGSSFFVTAYCINIYYNIYLILLTMFILFC
eukprot:GHVR01075187.1.p1 GENE.GHVR01075187.1~~GHVR01075187.1.p1  ORF type:complete len:127 (+),score=13.88 GHVR01075187.1:68-448(+)